MHTNTDDLEGINYIKGNKSKKDTVWFYLYAESEKQYEYTKQNRNIFIDTKHKLEVARGEEGGINKIEIGTTIHITKVLWYLSWHRYIWLLFPHSNLFLEPHMNTK